MLLESRIGPIDETAKAAYESCKDALSLVEDEIRTRFASDAQNLSDISSYLLALGGKRIRPILAILSARLFGMHFSTPELVTACAGIELIHMATLLHDDIIDKSAMRRHKESAYVRFGLPSTLLAGDFLLVRAFGMCGRLDKTLIDETEQACIRLTEGEELEGIINTNNQISIDTYRDVVGKKTGALFHLACLGGAHLAGAQRKAVDLMGEFGDALGLAFQMIDDILDVTADEQLLGKPAGTDLKQKTPSLVNILWLQSGDLKAREFFNIPEPTFDQAKSLIEHLLNKGIVDLARKHAKEEADRAKLILDELETFGINQETQNQLKAIVDYTLNRCL